MRNLFVIILVVILSLPLLFAIGPAIDTIFAEFLVPSSKSTFHNLTVDQLSTPRPDPIPISNSIASNNDCSTGWHIEGYFLPIESDYDGNGYAQTITIHSLNDTDNTSTRTLNSEFLKNVQIEGGGLTKEGDYIGSWNDQFWGPISSSAPVLGYPLVVGITSQTDRSLIPYGEIFTIPTLPLPWNTTTFMPLDRGSNIDGRQINIYTGVGSAAEKEKVEITGTENIVCTHQQASTQECKTDVLPNSTQVICDPDSTITTTNISIGDPVYDQFDSYIINATNRYGITDKMMMVKSMILQESNFDIFAVSPDIPCDVPDGWTDQESRSFGLMQVTPACVEPDAGRPNLTTDTNSSNWATSWFNPEYTINRGVKSLSDNLLLIKSNFPGCSNEQYMLMALGAYNSGQRAIDGCGEWNDRADEYITNVTTHHRILSQMVNILNAD
jgi:Transglycosylase SLT domain